jgi:3',5'-cyclic AMP phosphodiesterase CpdA
MAPKQTQVFEEIETACRDGALLIAYVSDTHLHQDEPIDPADPDHQDYAANPDPDVVSGRLRMILAELDATVPRPHFLVFGGDMTVRGRRGEWQKFFEIAETSRIPYHLSLGNHDHYEDEDRWHHSREAIRHGLPLLKMCRTPRQALTDVGLYYAAREGPWRLLFVDCPDAITKTLEPVQRRWLISQLTSSHAPTILVIHRPFLKVGNRLDAFTTHDPELLESIRAAGCVRLILSGHMHKARAWLYDDIPHLISSSCYNGMDDEPGYKLICMKDHGVSLTVTRYLKELGEDGPVRYQQDEMVPYSEAALQST